ncbi:MAG: DUF1564 family protein [Spirochaetales bacterium]|nr:DUF1564 family protein [Leptospiraceae bacterium]MCP5481262.1 DUF1564 family protein [Spirochaetales bacterium]MCP5485698.1 DUF1564 family protein [Spirochaetales bacterium]
MLVPFRHMEVLHRALETYDLQSVARFLPRLIRLAKRHPHLLPYRDQYTTFYQADNQDLQEVNFCPTGPQWAEFKLIARGCSVSNCYLFVHLMLLDANRPPSDTSSHEVSHPSRLELKEKSSFYGLDFRRRLLFEWSKGPLTL